ncbi:MYM-type Zinc finger with FCS sequence motif-containing protein [Desulfacinum hydrothermale DSM 13146]|uniref:MYM-type Zinc finger with FCS sequence motif-containing protein n=1 Tax=Desulfacinum hydrothermale DSM 13146 TaxID=1121390 RepID=A0A1W1X957_9BACT|nr:hypothetical protein [Desulfacinum hydrothermale]SMC20188.1 MYM-type Zinc finger with FCS sequence motif-containing protein [Desulfacinum hydrothermale DSM 13146]
MIRLLIYALLGYLLYRYFKPKLSKTDSEQDSGRADQQADLIKDPQCGTYFLKRHGVRARIGGKDVYFCSRQCRDSYLAGQGNPHGKSRGT